MKKNGISARAIFITDLFVIYACFGLVFIHYNSWGLLPLKAVLLMGYIGFLWFFIAISSSISNIDSKTVVLNVFKNTLTGFSVLCAGVVFAVAIGGEFRPNDKLILYPIFFAFISSLIFRVFYILVLGHLIKHGYKQKKLLLIGGGRVAKKVINQILASPEFGYNLHGVLAEHYHESLPGDLYLGKLERFSEIVRSHLADEVIVALPLRMEKEIIDIVAKCECEGIRVRIVPDFYRLVRNRAVMDKLGDIPLISIREEPLSSMKNRILKRGFDILFSFAMLILLSPLFLLLAVVIKLTSHGPVLFKQRRIGANNVEFDVCKFRTMIVQDNNESDRIWTTENDSRVTGIGKFMRKTNLDEFPQFWNVLIGNMSVVGPRPERGYFVEQFKEEIPNYKVRHLVKSGITGWAQVNGWRGNTSITKRVEHDIYYLENWNFWLDIKIIWLTVFGKKTNSNAY